MVVVVVVLTLAKTVATVALAVVEVAVAPMVVVAAALEREQRGRETTEVLARFPRVVNVLVERVVVIPLLLVQRHLT